MHAATFGAGPLFAVPVHDFAGLAQLPWFAALGVVCGLLATVIAKGLFAVEHAYRRLPVGEFVAPGHRRRRVGVARPARAHGRSASATTSSTTPSPGGSPSARSLALAVGKLVIWWIALASGTSGGTLAPILIISSCTGG